MGPFELMDLVGVDTGFEVALSFYELSFGEPRWRPSPISARYVAAGLHGRKSGRGYYDYGRLAEGGSHREPDPEPLSASKAPAEGVLVISGAGVLAGEAADRGAARMVLCAGGSLCSLDPGGSAVGFHVLPPFSDANLVELTRGESSSPLAGERAERLLAALGKHVAWVGDAPGLVLGRIVCQLINECAFALGEGVGAAADIDTGMLLGLSHPRGPLRWADEIGLEHVLGVLDALSDEYREERYRPAPVLRRLLAAGRTGRAAGGGFFDYPG